MLAVVVGDGIISQSRVDDVICQGSQQLGVVRVANAAAETCLFERLVCRSEDGLVASCQQRELYRRAMRGWSVTFLALVILSTVLTTAALLLPTMLARVVKLFALKASSRPVAESEAF